MVKIYNKIIKIESPDGKEYDVEVSSRFNFCHDTQNLYLYDYKIENVFELPFLLSKEDRNSIEDSILDNPGMLVDEV
jgi:hypothetical protein